MALPDSGVFPFISADCKAACLLGFTACKNRWEKEGLETLPYSLLHVGGCVNIDDE
ncbi:hypothetical protein [uncultured Gammaproteobacteria bacterium]|nr:hypothetical protein [uncultured Gammaproteobacteria bacterium]